MNLRKMFAWPVLAVLALGTPLPAQTKPATAPAYEPAPGEIFIDSTNTVAIKTQGKVTTGRSTPDAPPPIGGSFLNLGTWSKANTGDRRVTITPNLPAAGDYEVHLRWVTIANYHGLAKKFPLTIVSADGTLNYTISQQAGNIWAYLGTYRFDAGQKGSVTLSDEDSVGVITMDAIKFVPVKLDRSPIKKHYPQPAGVNADFDKLRRRVADAITTPSDVDESDPEVSQTIASENLQAHLWWQTMNRDPAAKTLWHDTRVPDNTGGNNTWEPYKRIRAMAKAYVYASPKYGFGQRMVGNKQLRDDILLGLDWLNKNAYNETTKNPAGAAWFGNEIGIPRDIAETINLMYTEVPEELRQRNILAIKNMTIDPRKFYIKAFNSTGANRLWLCQVHIYLAMLEHDPERMKLAVSGLDEPLTTVDRAAVAELETKRKKGSLDGFHADGSFIQHAYLPYFTGYGHSMLTVIGSIVGLVSDTPWAVDSAKQKIVAGWFFNGVEPLFYNGTAFARHMGRGISMEHGQYSGGMAGTRVSAIKLLPLMALEDAARTKSIIKYWALENPYKTKLGDLNAYAIEKDIVSDPAIKPATRPIVARVFHNSDFVVMHRPGFAVALSMSSTRIATHECIWTANRRGWYQGDGMLMIHTPDLYRYVRDYWPTVNPYRLAGTTVDTQPRKDGEDNGANAGALSKSPWAGGVEHQRRAASASMLLMAQESSLTAKKSWFFFGDEIICLGSDINASDDRTIETIVENAALNDAGDNAFTVNDAVKPAQLGWSEDLAATRSAHLAGSMPGSDMGFYFPQPTDLKALREKREATWNVIYRINDITPVSRNYLTMLIDHGKSPKAASYAYVILPGASSAQTKTYADKPPVEVLANTADVHAVRHRTLNLTGVQFWTPGSKIAGIKAGEKCAVLVEESGSKIVISISDPTQLQQKLTLEMDAKAAKVVAADSAVKVESLSPLKLVVNAAASNGRTFTVELSK